MMVLKPGLKMCRGDGQERVMKTSNMEHEFKGQVFALGTVQ